MSFRRSVPCALHQGTAAMQPQRIAPPLSCFVSVLLPRPLPRTGRLSSLPCCIVKHLRLPPPRDRFVASVLRLSYPLPVCQHPPPPFFYFFSLFFVNSSCLINKSPSTLPFYTQNKALTQNRVHASINSYFFYRIEYFIFQGIP